MSTGERHTRSSAAQRTRGGVTVRLLAALLALGAGAGAVIVAILLDAASLGSSMRPRAFALTLLAVVAASASVARADGDPGSDVLAYQRLFLATDAGVSVPQQAQLGDLLRRANQAGLPVRVAIIASRSDLGAITALWRKPRAYARFLGIELSLAYKGRLLVVMPNGFGVNWPGHATAPAYRALRPIHITPTGAGLATAAATALRSLSTAAHITIPRRTSDAGPAPAGARGPGGRSAARPNATDGVVGILAVLAALAAGALGLLARVRRRRRSHARPTTPRAPEYSVRRTARRSLRAPAAVAAVGVVAMAAVALGVVSGSTTARSDALATNPNLDPGTRLAGSEPDFTLSDEFGRSVSLRSFRGKVVILAFNDSECTTICPLSTSAMLDAKAMLGSAGRQLQLLGIDANPRATALADVLSYSQLHGMLGQWHFLTGSLAQLRRVWKAYSIGVDISRRLIDHTPAVFVIDTHGRLARLYITQQSYAAVDQFGQLLAQEASRLFPDHPPVNSHLTYTKIPGIPPAHPSRRPAPAGDRSASDPDPHHACCCSSPPGTSRAAASPDSFTRSTATRPPPPPPRSCRRRPPSTRRASNQTPQRPPPSCAASRTRSPTRSRSTATAASPTDTASKANHRSRSPHPRAKSSGTGRSQPPAGSALASSPSTSTHSRAPKIPSSVSTATQQLAGSPAAIAALHQQASRLLGNQQALTARIRALRGYPIVINAWASWCTPCRAEFGLFASAAARDGRQVAFLGADTGDAQAFLTQNHVSYPSYQTNTSDLRSLAVIEGLPTTIFINRAGKVAYVHTGQYDAPGSLDADIASHANGS